MKRTLISTLAAGLFLALPAFASPSDDDVTEYRARLQFYLTLKQSPDQIAVSLGNYFGRQHQSDGTPYFQTRNNADGTVDVIYVEGDGNTIRFIANLEKLKPVYEVAP
jgi:hypothetical protein